MYFPLPERAYSLISSQKNTILLETSRFDRENYQSWIFVKPIQILQAQSPEELPGVFAEIEKYLANSFYIAGFLGYECGFCFENISFPLPPFPIAWVGIYEKPAIFDHNKGTFQQDFDLPYIPNSPSSFECKNPQFNLNPEEYHHKIDSIKDLIKEGEVYQLNFTGKFHFRFEGSSLAFYRSLKKKQTVSYGAFIQTEKQDFLCFSPELFFRLDQEKLVTKPMKGTVPRGKTTEEDLFLQSWLQQDPKNRAENVMIVDLLRNDMGKIAEMGSVKIQDLYSIEKYQTLFQMTSTIEGKIPKDLPYFELFRSLFPSGSITGAPKIRAMEMINRLEKEPRGIYTGAIGFISPQRKAVFNVAIRTIGIEENRGEMGIGSGVVWDSEAKKEFQECFWKARFFTDPFEEFELIETMLWNGTYPRLTFHTRRIKDSAQYFDFPFDLSQWEKILQDQANLFSTKQNYKVRVTLNEKGVFSVQSIPLEHQAIKSNRIAFSKIPTQSESLFLYHKTTNREIYNQMYTHAVSQGFADVIFINEKGQVTEGSISNVFLLKGDVHYTPSVSCGLLKGTYREYLLSTLEKVKEEEIYPEDLLAADRIFICNGVSELSEVFLDSPPVHLEII